MTFIHIGKKIPKHLLEQGWEEKSSLHLGRGIWSFRLEKKENDKT